MKTKALITTTVAVAMALTSAAALAQGNGGSKGGDRGANAQQRAQVERGQRDFDRDRMRDRDRIAAPQHDRDRVKDRTKAPENAGFNENNIYGYNLMTDAERTAYRERIMNAESRQEREQIEAQHRLEMQVRAKNRNIKIDEAGKPIKE
ncbi:MAG: hypothetical protein QNI98_09750 [Woeseiaceae bacterium]|nr:hypothetical protein [Woeseiaceae bacterium]